MRIAAPRVEFVGALGDGAFVLRAGDFGRERGTWRQPVTIVRIAADGGPPDTLAVLPGEEFFGSRFQGRPVYGLRPFGRHTAVAGAGEAVLVNTGDDCTLAVLGPGGRVDRLVRAPCVRRRLSGDAIASFEDARIARLRTARAQGFARAVYAAHKVPYPALLPPYARLLVDDVGALWAERYGLPTDSLRYWDVFRADGRLLGTVMTPGDLTIEAITAERVLGVVRDSLGRARIQVHALVRTNETTQGGLPRARHEPL